ncbi:MAG: hypothetical protein ACREPE_00550 [Lysobacter sp.]
MTVPGRLFLVSTLVAGGIVSSFAAQLARAQQGLPPRASPSANRVDATGDPPTVTPAASSTPPEAIVVPVKALAPEAVLAIAESVTVRAPATTSSASSIIGSPSSRTAPMDAANVARQPVDASAIAEAPIAPACDEISRCERLEVVRSGVGVEAPKDDATKRRPENAAKRHVLQSVRSVW